MKLQTLSLSLVAAGLLLGCNPDPRPPETPTGAAAPALQNPSMTDATNTIRVVMNQVSAEGIGEDAGTIDVHQTANGLVFIPNLKGLTMGQYGFHIHENPNCEAGMKDGEQQAAAAAGGHYDPTGTGQHEGPQGDGHLGDLPMIQVDTAGVQQQVTINGLKLDDLRNRSLVVHQGRDDYSSDPAGDSGPPIACGVVQ